MFTGLITAIGSIAKMDADMDMVRVQIAAPAWDCAGIAKGASIAVNGICLTATDITAEGFSMEASVETLNRTTMKNWRIGHAVNLERSLKLGDELGGHFVFGHVDCVAHIAAIDEQNESRAITITAPGNIMPLIAVKGSVAIDGVSLTINEIAGNGFSVMVIPHTWRHTTLAERKTGDAVNLEADMLARYVARQIQKDG